MIYQGSLRMQEIAKEHIKEMRSIMGVSGAWKKFLECHHIDTPQNVFSRIALENSDVIKSFLGHK